MSERTRIISLILIMTVITVSVVAITTFLLYRAAFEEETLFIEIEDQGKGFDRAALTNQVSAGLSGMQERAYALGGALEIVSNPGVGTRVTATILFPDIT